MTQVSTAADTTSAAPDALSDPRPDQIAADQAKADQAPQTDLPPDPTHTQSTHTQSTHTETIYTETSHAAEIFRSRFAPDRVADHTYHTPNDIILFMHIPKTAGMSVGKALQAGFDIFHPVSWENTNPSFRNKTRQALYRRSDTANPCRQVLMGHFSWAEVMYWRHQDLPVKCATIIRDPLARFVSNYRYNISERHPQHAAFAERYPTLESYAEMLPYDYQLSLMTGAFYSFDHALEKLNANYSFIGVTEHLGASLEHFRRSHGLPDLQEHRENTGSGPKAETEISDAVRNMVGEKSRNDARLHQLVMTCFAAETAPA